MGIETNVPETNPFHVHNALLQWAYKPLCIQTRQQECLNHQIYLLEDISTLCES